MSTTAKKDQGNQARDAAGQAMDKARDAAGSAGEAVQNAAGYVGDKARDAAGYVGQKASDAASYVGQKADDATTAAGKGIEGAAQTVRDSGPQSGVLGSATRGVADAMESAGSYLQDKQLTDMMGDVTGLIKRNPVPAVLIGLGIGFLLGRALASTSSSSSNRSY